MQVSEIYCRSQLHTAFQKLLLRTGVLQQVCSADQGRFSHNLLHGLQVCPALLTGVYILPDSCQQLTSCSLIKYCSAVGYTIPYYQAGQKGPCAGKAASTTPVAKLKSRRSLRQWLSDLKHERVLLPFFVILLISGGSCKGEAGAGFGIH